MRVISSNKLFEKTLLECINKYDDIYISVAWASAKTRVFEALINNKKKITVSTIGTHFYQTDPQVLKEFIDSDIVHFITQPAGVFHPKIYLFTKGNEWEAIIGSANMTTGALTVNQEISIHLSNRDSNAKTTKNSLLENINRYFSKASSISENDYIAYRNIWKQKRKNRDDLSAIYGGKTGSKSPINSEIMSMKWEDFIIKIKENPADEIDTRLELLEIIKNGFKDYSSFQKMPRDLRKIIAGLPNNLYENEGWFGGMSGSGHFHSAINMNNIHISRALNKIPLTSDISRTDYMSFIEEYREALPLVSMPIGTASRLLAMKRPDFFVCINAKNKPLMCRDFGINITGMTYERYWDELISRIHDSVWWSKSSPEDGIDKEIWNGRVALLDCIFYRY